MPRFFLASLSIDAPVPPLVIANVPVTPGVILAEPLKDAVDVLLKFVRIVLAVASFVAVAELPVQLADEPLIFAAIVFVLGFNVTPLSKYAVVVAVAVCPLGASNNG